MNHINRDDLMATMRRHRICVLIPTYNNAGTLERIISETLECAPDVIVVNDGSTDNSPEIIASFGDSIISLTHRVNRGKGAALKTGLMAARSYGYEYAITLDSDGQHYPENIPDFVAAIIENKGALIIGERDLSCVDINGKSSFANKFSNFWFYVQTGRKLKDTQTGYRAYPLRHLYGLKHLTGRYEAELELLVLASWHGVEIKTIPIKVYYPPRAERISHFRPGPDFTRISILNTILCVAAIVYGAPIRIANAVIRKRLFAKDFKPFTHNGEERKEKAVTLARIFRSAYCITYYAGCTFLYLKPLSFIYSHSGKPTDEKKLRYHKMLHRQAGMLTRRFPACKTVFENIDNETFARPALIISNHQSIMDIPVIMAVHPKIIFLTNDRVRRNLFYDTVIRNGEFMPVSEGFDKLMPKLRELTERGYSVVVFPEGTRSDDGRILRFHQGAFHIARELGLDILPMTLHGAGNYLSKHDLLLSSGQITLHIGSRIHQNQLANIAPLKQASNFRKIIKDEYSSIARHTADARYYKDYVLLKYAYRGWAIVSRCKKVLKNIPDFQEIIDGRGDEKKKVRIFNSGIGTFALLYALVNRDCNVYAYESNKADYTIATSTEGLPANLHFIHAVWNSEFDTENDSDLDIILNSAENNSLFEPHVIHINIKS